MKRHVLSIFEILKAVESSTGMSSFRISRERTLRKTFGIVSYKKLLKGPL